MSKRTFWVRSDCTLEASCLIGMWIRSFRALFLVERVLLCSKRFGTRSSILYGNVHGRFIMYGYGVGPVITGQRQSLLVFSSPHQSLSAAQQLCEKHHIYCR